MSYVRFGEADVYVFTSREGIECCGCWLQKSKWVSVPDSPLGGWFEPVGEIIPHLFRSNQQMIEHLEKHKELGHHVPDFVFERLRDPEDEKENWEIWNKYDKGKRE